MNGELDQAAIWMNSGNIAAGLVAAHKLCSPR